MELTAGLKAGQEIVFLRMNDYRSFFTRRGIPNGVGFRIDNLCIKSIIGQLRWRFYNQFKLNFTLVIFALNWRLQHGRM